MVIVNHYPHGKNKWRIKDSHTVMVILNSSLTDQTLKMDRFSDVIANYAKGKDVVTTNTIDLTKPAIVPAKGGYVLDLVN